MLLIPALVLLVIWSVPVRSSDYTNSNGEKKASSKLFRRRGGNIIKSLITDNKVNINVEGAKLGSGSKKKIRTPKPFSANLITNYITSAISGISNFLDAIDDLEFQHCQKLVQDCKEQCVKMEELEIASKVHGGNFSDSEIDTSEGPSSGKFSIKSRSIDNFNVKDDKLDDLESASKSMSTSMSMRMSISKSNSFDNVGHCRELCINTYDQESNFNHDQEFYYSHDQELHDIKCHDQELHNIKCHDQESHDIKCHDQESHYQESNDIKNQEFNNININDINSIENLLQDSSADYVQLSDSDSESWEKVEANIKENVQVLLQKSESLQLLTGQQSVRQSIIEFLGTIFVKLARRLLLINPKPRSQLELLSKSSTFDENDEDDDFVNVLPDDSEIYKEEELEHFISSSYSFLDFETAHRILYYDDFDSDHSDWSLVPSSPQDYANALEFLKLTALDDLAQIEIDLPRLSGRYHEFYGEKLGKRSLEMVLKEELTEKIRLILIFIMAHNGNGNDSVKNNNKPIVYTQGFDQVVAYFAINFELNSASTLAYKFFQLYLSDLINVGIEDLGPTARRIDARAVEIVRKFLKDQVVVTNLNFEVLLKILELYPFSDRTATILYFNSATTWSDLDRLVQFLLIKVPQSEASKSVSLLAGANMLYSMLALDTLFYQELGGKEWSDLKNNFKGGNDKNSDALDSLVLQFMGEMFILFSDKLVHKPSEFGDFLKVAESLVPYLSQVNSLDG